VLANFALMLLKDGKIVATSNSAVDNVEQLSLKVKNSGNYSIQVYRTEEGGERNETFGVATRVLNNPPILNSIEPALALAATGGGGGVMRSIDDPISVPEPGVITGLLGFALGLGRRRRV
jgi:hypothetical protein